MRTGGLSTIGGKRPGPVVEAPQAGRSRRRGNAETGLPGQAVCWRPTDHAPCSGTSAGPIAPLETTLIRPTVFSLVLASLSMTAPFGVQAYPDKVIEWVVPYPPGGGTDVVARTVAEPMGKALGQSIIINNKPGAATNIGADYVARAKPDGYVLLTGDTATLAANPALYNKLTYKADEFVSIGLLARFPMLLVVSAGVPAKTLAEFRTWVKAQPNGASYATPGAGSPHHLATELFRSETGLNLTHVPYRGAAPAVQDVVGGQVPFMFIDSATGIPYVESGKLRAIGVASPQPVAAFKDVPTLASQGLTGFEAYAWQGLVAPKGTPASVVEVLNKALRESMATAPVKARFDALGLEAIPGTPEEMSRYASAEREKWGKVIRAANIQLD